MNLALHQVTVMDVDPLTLIDLAADAGCTGVSVFTHTPKLPTADGAVDLGFPLVTEAMLPAFRARLKERGVSVGNIEFFPLGIDPSFEEFRCSLALGAELGARMAVAHLHDPEPLRAAESLARFGMLANEYGLGVGLEFMPLSPACPSLHVAVERILASGSRNVRLGIDALHLERSGGSPADVAAIDPALIGYSQICDGPGGIASNYSQEALDRQVAGTGQFPLRALARALPAHTAYEIETPLARLIARGVPAAERVRMTVGGARWMLAELQRQPTDISATASSRNR
jgi:sugar phosphate isomerase/epimerase